MFTSGFRWFSSLSQGIVAVCKEVYSQNLKEALKILSNVFNRPVSHVSQSECWNQIICTCKAEDANPNRSFIPGILNCSGVDSDFTHARRLSPQPPVSSGSSHPRRPAFCLSHRPTLTCHCVACKVQKCHLHVPLE